MIIENMGGKIALEHSEEGKGSTFSFTLAVALPTATHEHSEKPDAPHTDSATGLSVPTAR